MHDRNGDSIRLLKVTAGNLRQNHLYIHKHLDFFPAQAVGASKKANSRAHCVSIELDGLGTVIETDIGVDAKTGSPRRFIRDRAGIGRFFRHHRVAAGAELELRRLSFDRFRLSIHREASGLVACEFFAGIGLVRLSLEENGFRVVYANDIDPDKKAMYEANFPPGEFHLGDIRNVSGDDIPDCHVCTASFPCTDLSIAGAMRGLRSGESSMFWEFTRILREMGKRRPNAILLENVPGFLMSHEGRDLEAAISALNELGYACDAAMLDAARFVPQSRLRLFVVGRLGADASSPFGTAPSILRPPALLDFILAHPHLKWDLQQLPDAPDLQPTLSDIVEDLADNDPRWWDAARTDYFMNQLSKRHEAAALSMIHGERVSYATAFRRVRHGRSMAELRTDGIAGCLRTPKGGSGRQILFKAGLGRHQVRLLTPRECARLQGVHDSYVIKTRTDNQAYFGFGDAVCVPVVSWVIKHLVKAKLTCEREG